MKFLLRNSYVNTMLKFRLHVHEVISLKKKKNEYNYVITVLSHDRRKLQPVWCDVKNLKMFKIRDIFIYHEHKMENDSRRWMIHLSDFDGFGTCLVLLLTECPQKMLKSKVFEHIFLFNICFRVSSANAGIRVFQFRNWAIFHSDDNQRWMHGAIQHSS